MVGKILLYECVYKAYLCTQTLAFCMYTLQTHTHPHTKHIYTRPYLDSISMFVSIYMCVYPGKTHYTPPKCPSARCNALYVITVGIVHLIHNTETYMVARYIQLNVSILYWANIDMNATHVWLNPFTTVIWVYWA